MKIIEGIKARTEPEYFCFSSGFHKHYLNEWTNHKFTLSINFTTSISICQNKGVTIIINNNSVSLHFKFIVDQYEIVCLDLSHIGNRTPSAFDCLFLTENGRSVAYTLWMATIVYGRIFRIMVESLFEPIEISQMYNVHA